MSPQLLNEKVLRGGPRTDELLNDPLEDPIMIKIFHNMFSKWLEKFIMEKNIVYVALCHFAKNTSICQVKASFIKIAMHQKKLILVMSYEF